MAAMRALWNRHRSAGATDSGFTLIELIVAMGIFSIFLSVMTAAVGGMTNSLRKTQGIADSADQARRVFDRLDRQIRYADAVNRETKVGQNWYIEFRTFDSKGVKTCRQWRLVAAQHRLQERSWTGTPVPAPAWTTVATGVVNAPATQRPFTFVPAGTTRVRQQVQLQLFLERGGKAAGKAATQTVLVARNTGVSTVTNDDANGDGASDIQVCTEAGRS